MPQTQSSTHSQHKTAGLFAQGMSESPASSSSPCPSSLCSAVQSKHQHHLSSIHLDTSPIFNRHHATAHAHLTRLGIKIINSYSGIIPIVIPRGAYCRPSPRRPKSEQKSQLPLNVKTRRPSQSIDRLKPRSAPPQDPSASGTQSNLNEVEYKKSKIEQDAA